MLVTNETCVPLDVQFLSMEDYGQMSCIINMKLWLFTHFIHSFFIQSVFLQAYVGVLACFFLFFLVSSDFRSFAAIIKQTIACWTNQENEFWHGFTLIIQQINLIFIYILFAFLFKLLVFANNEYPVTSMNIYHWLAEAMSMPYVLYGFFAHCIGYAHESWDIYQECYVIEILLKIPLFIFMRYGENHRGFFLNDLEASFINKFCTLYTK